jgi:hypothetical protein
MANDLSLIPRGAFVHEGVYYPGNSWYRFEMGVVADATEPYVGNKFDKAFVAMYERCLYEQII